MPGTLTPSQDYDHVLNIVSGSDGMHDLIFEAQATTDTYNNLNVWNRGSLICMWIDGMYLGFGIRMYAGGWPGFMPMWAINAPDDLDVNGDVGNFTDRIVGGLVATGGYEIFTTEFFEEGDYEPNQLLTFADDDAPLVTKSPTLYSENDIVGCVSRGITTDVYGQRVLNFWTMFIPALSLI